MAEKYLIIPIFIPHKGCPFDCIYCNQKEISGEFGEITEKQIQKTIELYTKNSKFYSKVEIAFYGGSFTGIDINTQTKFLEIAKKFIKEKKVHSIRISTRPDYINDKILKFLKHYNVETIELGVQSMNDEVLALQKRGHTSKDVIVASKLIHKYKINLGIQTMVGLLGDTPEKIMDTANSVIALNPKYIRIYPVLVIKNTFLEKLFSSRKYIPYSLDDAVTICAKLLNKYRENNLQVIRIGLQPTDNINLETSVVAGPFHPAFRELVESKLALKCIEDAIINKKLLNKKNLNIVVGKKYLSIVVGQKKSNLIYLKQKYGYNIIAIKVDDKFFPEKGYIKYIE